MFKKEYENVEKFIKGQENTKQADKETEKRERYFLSPPYLPSEGEFPILKGTVEVTEN